MLAVIMARFGVNSTGVKILVVAARNVSRCHESWEAIIKFLQVKQKHGYLMAD